MQKQEDTQVQHFWETIEFQKAFLLCTANFCVHFLIPIQLLFKFLIGVFKIKSKSSIYLLAEQHKDPRTFATPVALYVTQTFYFTLYHKSPNETLTFCTVNIYSAAAAESLQSCPTLCDPIDSSPPGSPVPGILQARTLEWVAIAFSNA